MHSAADDTHALCLQRQHSPMQLKRRYTRTSSLSAIGSEGVQPCCAISKGMPHGATQSSDFDHTLQDIQAVGHARAMMPLLVTYREEWEPQTSSHIHMGERLPAERHHQSLEAFGCDITAALQAEGAQCCERGRHTQSAVADAAMVQRQVAQMLQTPAHRDHCAAIVHGTVHPFRLTNGSIRQWGREISDRITCSAPCIGNPRHWGSAEHCSRQA